MNKFLNQVLNKLSTYTYGILYNDGAFVSDKDEMDRRDGTDIIVQTPEMMDEHKSGMCHDASIYIDEVLTDLGIDHKIIYIASHVEPMLPTHSFVMMFDEDSKSWICIDIFASKDCILHFEGVNDFNEIVDKRIARWIEDDNSKSANLSVFICDHLPEGGQSFLEWSESVVNDADMYDFSKGYVHLDYKGTGIYQALKRAVGWEWKKLLQNKDINWLPKPPEYNGKCRSYFTMKGYREFQEKVMPIIKKYMDTSFIYEEYVEELNDSLIEYSDEFQVVMKKDIRGSLSTLLNRLSSYDAQIVNSFTGKRCTATNDEDRLKVYRLQSPKVTSRMRCGFCWDISLCAINSISKMGVKAVGLFVVELSDEAFPLNHTTVAINLDDGVHIFEASWKEHKGIHGPFSNMRRAAEEVMSWVDESRDDKRNGLCVFKMNKHPHIGCTPAEYISEAMSNEILFEQNSYAPPYTYDEVVQHYGEKIADNLKKDPAHKWRMETGIELIHKEPSKDVQERIWKNWQLMSKEQKQLSDKKSIELFGMTNEEHNEKIMRDYMKFSKFNSVYEAAMKKLS